MAELETSKPLVKLFPDICGGGLYNWPDGSLAVFPSVTRDGHWFACPQGETFTGVFHPSKEEAAQSVGATIYGERNIGPRVATRGPVGSATSPGGMANEPGESGRKGGG